MGFRETLNRNSGMVSVAVGAVIVVILAVTIRGTLPGTKRAAQAYYSDDDGKTFFADDAKKICPFDHNGKPAYAAFVYECPGRPQFVNYLARYTDSAKAKMEEAAAKPDDAALAAAADEVRQAGMEVKKPGATKWVSANSAEGRPLLQHPQCQNGIIAENVWP